MKYDYLVDYEFAKIDTCEFNRLLLEFPGINNVVIYGAGYQGKLICENLELRGITVECFCDKDEAKQAGLYYGKPVISPHELYAQAERKIIIVTAFNYQKEIEQTLIENGVDPKIIVLPPYKVLNGSICVPEDAMPETCKRNYALAAKSISKNKFKEVPINPQITVSTSVYNVRESYLRRAIESILNQTYTNFRYLITDNASTDGSADIIKEYAEKDSRITILTNKRNLSGTDWYSSDYGMAQRRKRLECLTTKYLCTLDSDDYYTLGFLESAYRLAEEYGADIVAGQTVVYYEQNPESILLVSSAPIGGPRVYTGQRELADAVLDHNFIFCVSWGKLMKTKLYLLTERTPHRSAAGGLNDVLGNLLRITKSNKIVMTDKIWHYHTWHDGGISKNLYPKTKPVTSTLFVYSQLLEFLKQAGAENASNADSLLEVHSFSRLNFDLELLEKSSRLQPELVVKSINDILASEIPGALKADLRMDVIFARLNEILKDAKEHSVKGGAL